jgi:hypothetical protein
MRPVKAQRAQMCASSGTPPPSSQHGQPHTSQTHGIAPKGWNSPGTLRRTITCEAGAQSFEPQDAMRSASHP